MSYQKELKEMSETEKQHNQTTGVIINYIDIDIDEDYVLKINEDGEKNFWCILVSFLVSKSDPLPALPEPEPFLILFEIELPASEKAFGADKAFLKNDLKIVIDNFKKSVKKYANIYEVNCGTTVDYQVKFGVENYYGHKVFIFKLPCEII